MSGIKGMIHYSLEIKLQVIQMHEEDGLTYAQVAALQAEVDKLREQVNKNSHNSLLVNGEKVSNIDKSEFGVVINEGHQ